MHLQEEKLKKLHHLKMLPCLLSSTEVTKQQMVSHRLLCGTEKPSSHFGIRDTPADSMQVKYQARKASRPGFTSFGDRQSSQTWRYKQMCLTRLNKSTMCFGETWLNPSIKLPGILIKRMEPLTLESACSRIPLYLP